MFWGMEETKSIRAHADIVLLKTIYGYCFELEQITLQFSPWIGVSTRWPIRRLN